MTIHVLDNVISLNYQRYIQTIFEEPKFPWYFVKGISDSTNSMDTNSGFASDLYDSRDLSFKSQYSDSLVPLLLESLDKFDQGELEGIYRIRAGMFLKNQTDKPHLPHIDNNEPHHTMLYYAIDSDGPTEFYEGDEVIKVVEPKMGRAVIFPGNIYHASSVPHVSPFRIVLTLNFLLSTTRDIWNSRIG